MVLKTSSYVLLAAVAAALITAHEHYDSPKDQILEPSGFQFPYTPFTGSGFQFLGFGNLDRKPEPPPKDRPTDRPRNPSAFRQVVRCNYTAEPGNTCVSCDQTMFCSQLNYGVSYMCQGRKPYCNKGLCSTKRSEECGL